MSIDEEDGRFAFLVDQEYQRQRDEEAAVHKPRYTPGWKDYGIFVYFCVNVAVIGNPLLNSNAMLRAWKNSEMFRPENPSQLLIGWSDVQMLSSKTALLLAQAAIAGSGMMGGVLVDTFSASMCLLVAHLMYGAGAYFFKCDASREIFMGALLQGVAGELLLNSVLPICGLFGQRQYVMLLILTCCADLSVLTFPIILKFFAPDTPITAIHEEFYKHYHHSMVYFAWLTAVIGTFILPVDDNGNLTPVTKSGIESANRKAPGTLRSPNEVRVLNDLAAEDPRDRWNDEGDDEEDEELTRTLIDKATAAKNATWTGSRFRKPVSLWTLRFTKKLRTVQFLICCLMFACCVFRNSFYLNNNQQLLEAVGDDGLLSTSFMWMMGLGAIFGPLAWHLNDCLKSTTCMLGLCCIGMLVSVLVMVEVRSVQWVTLVLIVAGRSACLPTLLTYAAGVFGLRHFPAISVLVALCGAFANFLNVLVDKWAEHTLLGDYLKANWLMIGVGIFTFVLLLLHWMYPTLNEPDANDEDYKQSDILREAVGSVNANVRGAHPLTVHQLRDFTS